MIVDSPTESTTNLLIGGSGFIGSALGLALVEQGEKVISVSRSSGDKNGSTENIVLDLTYQDLPTNLVDRADSVFILIGQTGLGFDPEKEKILLKKVVEPFRNNHQKIFYFSTVMVYGNCLAPATEDDICQPIGPYPKFKLEAESIIKNVIPSSRLVILRLANVYGSPKNKGFIGSLLNRLTSQSKDQFIVNGNGQLRRDYIFLDDVVGAILAIKNRPDSSGIINIATGQSLSLLQVIETLSRITDKKIAYQTRPEMPEEAKDVLLSNLLLRRKFGYNSFVSLENGLRTTLDRYKQHG